MTGSGFAGGGGDGDSGFGTLRSSAAKRLRLNALELNEDFENQSRWKESRMNSDAAESGRSK